MLIHFINPEEKYLITTNYKVWFSTLTNQKSLTRSTSSRVTGYRHFLFARNPYDRLESFYRDKLFDAPSYAVFSPAFKWQNSQQIFLNRFGQTGWSFEDERKYLQSISFPEFIELLAHVYYRDEHLVPQTILWRDGNKSLSSEFDRILKVEDADCLEFIKLELKIDTSIKRNYTKHFKIDLVWSPEMRMIVNHLYKMDFVLLNYPMIG